jgi:hypothetical protein
MATLVARVIPGRGGVVALHTAQLRGDGVDGLQRALTVAGARSTLLSLRKVNDSGTAVFMKTFYPICSKGSPAPMPSPPRRPSSATDRMDYSVMNTSGPPSSSLAIGRRLRNRDLQHGKSRSRKSA